MHTTRNKRKVSKKSTAENPNQLSLEFLKPESDIEIHLPRQKINLSSAAINNSKRAMITLSIG